MRFSVLLSDIISLEHNMNALYPRPRIILVRLADVRHEILRSGGEVMGFCSTGWHWFSSNFLGLDNFYLVQNRISLISPVEILLPVNWSLQGCWSTNVLYLNNRSSYFTFCLNKPPVLLLLLQMLINYFYNEIIYKISPLSGVLFLLLDYVQNII